MLAARGLSSADAQITADGILDGDLRGVPTHGMAQLPTYLSLLDQGVTNSIPTIRIEGKGGLLRVEADRGLGQVVVVRTLEALKTHVRDQGMAGAAIANAGHLGGLGYFARLAAEAGLVSLIMQNGPPLMGLPGSKARAIGNNPLAFGAPVPGGPPLVFDIATSQAAYGKIMQAHKAGVENLPPDWALDSEGRPTTDPATALSGILMPAGGAKGIGLAMMVEVLAGSLSGTHAAGGNIFGGFVMLVDPLAVETMKAYEAHMENWIATYRRSGPDRRYPGERSAALRARQMQSGVVLASSLADTLHTLGKDAGIPLPPAL